MTVAGAVQMVREAAACHKRGEPTRVQTLCRTPRSRSSATVGASAPGTAFFPNDWVFESAETITERLPSIRACSIRADSEPEEPTPETEGGAGGIDSTARQGASSVC